MGELLFFWCIAAVVVGLGTGFAIHRLNPSD
jgi:hypothetical protein